MRTSADAKLIVCSSVLAAYARLVELQALQNSVTVVPVTPQDIHDYQRLIIWWNGLGEDKQKLVHTWVCELWVEVEAVTTDLWS